MKKFLLILIVTLCAYVTHTMITFSKDEHASESAITSETLQALAKSVKELLEKKGFAQEVGMFLGKYANQIAQHAEKQVNNNKSLEDLAQKIQRYAQLYNAEHRDLLHDFNKKENRLNKELYKKLDSSPKEEHAVVLDLHETAVKELHNDASFNSIKELAQLHDELTAIGLDVLTQLQKLFTDPEAFMDFIQDWVALVQKEFATTIKA